MRGYGQFCPVSKAAEIFAERWTPLILRDLLDRGRTFNAIRMGMPLISQSLLAQRLRSLEQAGIVVRRRQERGRGWEYHLTPAGEEFGPIVEQLGIWGQRWAQAEIRSEDIDPAVLMWFLYRHVNEDGLPADRVVVRFEFRDARRHRWWLILKRPEVDLCLKDPGIDEDLVVRSDSRTMTMVYLGRVSLADALARGLIETEGPTSLVRALPGWLGVSKFAPYAVKA